jgi:peptide/nickel transport system substrate-binding protein
MRRNLRALTVAAVLLIVVPGTETAFAQKPGGILRIPHLDSPASMSIHEESTISALAPMMGCSTTS